MSYCFPKIQAIKKLREIVDCGLKDAKEAVGDAMLVLTPTDDSQTPQVVDLARHMLDITPYKDHRLLWQILRARCGALSETARLMDSIETDEIREAMARRHRDIIMSEIRNFEDRIPSHIDREIVASMAIWELNDWKERP
jgi:hypothetical protein